MICNHMSNPNKSGSVRPIAMALRSLVTLVMLFSGTAAFAKGGETINPFPVSDTQPARQEAKAMARDSLGDIIVAGYSNVSGMNNDYRVVKFRGDGSGVAWRAPFDKGGGDHQALAVAVDGSNDVIVTGTVWNVSNKDIHTVKYSGVDGSIIWQQTWSGAAGGADVATGIAIDGAGNSYVAGYTANGGGNDDYLVIKYAPGGGAPLWVEIYNSPYNSNDRITAIDAGVDGIVVTGASSKGGTDYDMLTRKYSFDKSLVWEQRRASASTGDDRGVGVKFDPEGNVVATGYLYNGQNNEIYTVKYGAAAPGGAVWEQLNSRGSNNEPAALWLDGSGDIYLTGYAYTYSGNEDMYTVRYSAATGAKVWEKLYDSGSEYTDVSVAIIGSTGTTGDIFVTGYTATGSNDNFTTLKYKKSSGELVWQKNYRSPDNRSARPVGMALHPSGDPLVSGWGDTAVSSFDFVLVRYDFGKVDPPTGLTAVATSNSSISLSWRDNSANESGFIVERKLGENGTFAPIASLPEDSITYSDSGLDANSYYYYRVKAVSSANGDSDYSGEAHALTKVVSYEAPAWVYQYNGADNREDEAVGIVAGSDDHPIVTGFSDLTEEGVTGAYSMDYVTIKLDRATKAIKWKAVYDSGDGGTDMAAGIALDNNGDAIVTGTAYLSGGSDKSDDLYTIKYSSAGFTDPASNPPTAWGSQYGTQAGIDQATAVQTAKDAANNIVVIGHGVNAHDDEDMFVIKYAPDGTMPWPPVVFDGPAHGNDYPSAVAFDAAGNIFITGSTENAAGNFDIYTAKYSGATGALIWSRTYAGAGGGDDHGLSLAVDRSGNVYVAGYAVNSAGNEEWLTIKYDGADVSANRLVWQTVHNGAAAPINGNDRAMVLALDPVDGDLIVSGTSYRTLTDSDFHLIRYKAADGVIVWERNFDRPTKYDYVTAMVVDSSGYIYLTGNSRSGLDTDPAFDSSSDLLTLIYDFEGTFLSASEYDGGRMDEARAIAANYQGEAFVAGVTYNASNPDYLVLKQKNNYILVPAPFLPVAQEDSSRINLTWRNNTPGTSTTIERTAGPVLPTSVWTPVTTAAPGVASYLDSGLATGTSYCYRIYAFSGSLNSRTIITCATTTLGAPVLDVPAVSSAAEITINWSQVAGNSGYKVERRSGAGAWSDLAVKGAGVTTHTDSGLSPGTTYAYRVSTQSAAGYSLASNVQSAPTLPAAPSINAFTGITEGAVIVGWLDVAGETGYSLERKEDTGSVWGEVGTRAADVVSFSDSGLAANTKYNYRIRAYNASGYSAYSDIQTTMTRFTPTVLSSAVGTAPDKINLTWTNIPGSTGYTIQYISCWYNNPSQAATYCANPAYYNNYWSNLATVAADVTTYQVTGLAAGSAFRYQIVANTSDNYANPSNDIIGWTQMSPPVINVNPASETSLSVSWPDISGETNYTVEGRLGSGSQWIELPNGVNLAANTVNYSATGLALSTEYCYRVKAMSSNPNGPSPVTSNEQCKFTPLAAPVLDLPTTAANQVNLAWSNVAGNTGYELQRCEYANHDDPQNAPVYIDNESFWPSCTTLAALPADTVSYQDTGRPAGYTYRYRVRDLFSGGVSAWSAARVITTIPSATTINSLGAASTSEMNVSWNNIYGETSYNLQWKAMEGADCTAGDWSAPVSLGQNVTTYVQGGLTAGGYYCFRVAAQNSSGGSAYSAPLSQTTLAAAPVLEPLTGVSVSQAGLSWSNVSGNTGYRIERKLTAAGGWGAVYTTAADAVSYTDSGLQAGSLYYYRVSTLNAAGASAPSNEQSATTTPAPVTVSARTVSEDRIDLSWSLVYGATKYILERKEVNNSYAEINNMAVSYAESYCGNSYPTIACPSLLPLVTGFQNGGLTGNTTYCYQIKAWNESGGYSAASIEQCATTLKIASQSLSAVALNSFKIRLDWAPQVCSPNPCDTPDGYEVERMVRDGNWVQIATIAAGVTTFTDRRAIDPIKQYRYRIRSYSGSTRSPYSAEAVVYTPPYVPGDNVNP